MSAHDRPKQLLSFEPQDGFEPYQLLNSLVVPRPIAWVSTRSLDGEPNLAPFSYFQVASDDPAILMLSIGLKKSRRDERKDTLANIEQTGAFVVNLVPEHLAELMVRSASELPAGQSEFEALGLTAVPAQRVAAVLLAESPVNLECQLHQTLPMGGAMVVFGRIVLAHLDPEILNDRRLVDADKLRPIARLGESWYLPYRERIRIQRPK
jgi:flavin reductase (DIM6/NTAB) family NADH-FMN oxidoreductase RutF